MICYFFFFSSRRRHTRFDCDWSSDVCSSDLLSEAKAFFLDLGLKVQAEWELDGEQLDRIVGLSDVKTACVGLGMPDGQTWIELVKFYTPSDEKDIQQRSEERRVGKECRYRM